MKMAWERHFGHRRGRIWDCCKAALAGAARRATSLPDPVPALSRAGPHGRPRCGHRLERLPDRDPEAVRISGLKSHFVIRPTGNEADRVPGMVYLLNKQELEATDRYEGSDYRRVVLELESGRCAFVYVDPRVERTSPIS